ncbi:MAG: carboxypeptidase-like regulatory domain-containing protein, partial [Muribaculaceae bacterium]|nr:carboxypeptidase-like regulatory domain-containing protein [Muribaculaceae bacterium]
MRLSYIIFIVLGCVVSSQYAVAQYVRGQVIEEISRNPIAGVYLKCYPDSVYCVSDSLGFFSFEGITHNRIDIEARCIGYESAFISQILTASSKDLVMTIELKDKSNDLDEVVVSARHSKMLPQNEMALTSSRSFSVEECRRFAGGLDDPARMASNFAGCGPTTPGSNAIIVRGNAPASVLWRLEGIDIPSPVHFNGTGNIPGGGLYTIFSSFMLANSEFYSGCFPAEYFNTVGGVFNIKFRSGNPWKHEYSAQLGVQGLDLSAEGPLSRKNGSTFICNARLSTMQLLKEIIPELSKRQSVRYQDYCAKFDIPNTKIGRISIWGIMGNSNLIQDAADDPEEWISPDEGTDASMKNLMFASGISNEYTIDGGISMKNTIAVTRNCQYLNYGERHLSTPAIPASDYVSDDKRTDLILSSTLNQRLST